jgi:hypothetical protein
LAKGFHWQTKSCCDVGYQGDSRRNLEMTSIPHAFWFNHLTEIDGVKWRAIDWDSAKKVRDLKQEPFKGYVRWKVGGAWRDFTTANVEQFIDVIVPSLGRSITAANNQPFDPVRPPGTLVLQGRRAPVLEPAARRRAGPEVIFGRAGRY